MMMMIFYFLFSLISFSYSWSVYLCMVVIMMIIFFSSFPIMFDMLWGFFMNDLVSFSLFLLSLFITLLMLLSSYNYYKSNYYFYSFLIMFLMYMLIFSFFSSNALSFYFFFECSLIPTFLLIMGWGYQPERLQASIYFMFYTLFASLPLLLIIIFLFYSHYSISFFSIFHLLVEKKFYYFLMSLFFFLAFLVKLPMFFFHLWLPKAHVEAPVSGSMILAGVLLKLGGFGLIRFMGFSFSLMKMLSPLLFSLSISSMFFVGLICCRLNDLKALIAYSSVSHMGLVLAGLITFHSWGVSGSLLMMISHGLSSSGLFLIVNLYYDRFSSRSLFLNKGLIFMFPTISLSMFLLCAANISAPPTINLLSEIFLMYSSMNYSSYMMLLFPLGSFLGAVFTFFLFSFTQHGKSFNNLYNLTMINSREYHSLSLHIIPINTLVLKSSLFLI